MANPQRGEVRLEVGGKTYTLTMDLNTMCEIEEMLSTPDHLVTFQDVTRRMMGSSMIYIRAFFWGALRRHHPEVTLKGVSDLMQEAGGLAPFLAKVNDLMNMTKPDPEDQAVLQEGQRPRPTKVARLTKGGTGQPSTDRPEKLA